MSHPITASMLYNLTQCPTRVALDVFEDPAKMDKVSKFVELLWERGSAFERELIGDLTVPYTDLRELSKEDRESETTAALARGEQLICGGRIRHGRLLGEPDLLRLSDDGYVARGGDHDGSSGIAMTVFAEVKVRLTVYAGRDIEVAFDGGKTLVVFADTNVA